MEQLRILYVSSFIGVYREALLKPEIAARDLPDKDHISWMIAEIPKFQDREKMHRWIGFVQCWFYCNKIFTIDELKAHVKTYSSPI